MLFNSVTYLGIFLPVVCALYWLLKGNGRLWLLLSASVIFYGFWRIEFVPLMLGSAIMDYYLAIAIDKREDPVKRKRLLWISVVVNLGILGFFKYFLFFRDSLFSAAALAGLHPRFTMIDIVLPLGISFYIFQTLSYTIDVYRRHIPPERSLLRYMTFVTFYPHLVAGPIMRPDVLIPQLKNPAPFLSENVRKGIERILAGLFLKVVLADTVGGFVDESFAQDFARLSAFDVWTMSFLFGFQIYFDFAGYSSIAIGSAMMMSIDVPENFDSPYAATSPREFWKRWHISLSTWIRDYLYIPMLGNARNPGQGAWDTLTENSASVSEAKRARALFATWAIMGLWHGANWTFVLWGLYHAVMIFFQRLLSPLVRLPGGFIGWAVSVGITLPLMMAAWIPFRARSVADAFRLWGKLANPRAYRGFSLVPNAYFLAAALALAFFVSWGVREQLAPRMKQEGVAFLMLKTGYLVVMVAMVVLMLEARAQFIYFQF